MRAAQGVGRAVFATGLQQGTKFTYPQRDGNDEPTAWPSWVEVRTCFFTNSDCNIFNGEIAKFNGKETKKQGRGLNSPPQHNFRRPNDRLTELSRGPDMVFLQSKWNGKCWTNQGNKEKIFPWKFTKNCRILYIHFVLKRCQFCEIQSVPNKQRGKRSSCFSWGICGTFPCLFRVSSLGEKHEYTEPNWKMSNSHVLMFSPLLSWWLNQLIWSKYATQNGFIFPKLNIKKSFGTTT